MERTNGTRRGTLPTRRRKVIAKGDRIEWAGQTAEVRSVDEAADGRFELVLRVPDGTLTETILTADEVAQIRQPSNDGEGRSEAVLAALWGQWMQWATPRIRSAATATKPLKPYAHQDEAVFVHMLPQPRLRFLLADEPGTGKTIMTGMYMAEGRRSGAVSGKVLIVPPAHLVTKWIDDLQRFFGIDAERLDTATARSPRPLRSDVDVWVVSVDLFTHNPDVLRKTAGAEASWSLVVFDEAHRLTPTSQYLGAARQVAAVTHHLLLLTATPHRGKEWYFQELLHLLNPDMYPVTAGPGDSGDEHRIRPAEISFLRRMKEDLRGHDGSLLFKERFAETKPVPLSPAEQTCYDAVMDYVDEWYGDTAVLARSIYGKRAASSVTAAAATLRRRAEALSTSQAAQVAPPAPGGFEAMSVDAAVDDDESWDRAEDAVVAERSRDRRGELKSLKGALDTLEAWMAIGELPTKWRAVQEICSRHEISPGEGQLLVFTEFTDTAHWLQELFDRDGYTTRLLSGGTAQVDRDQMQRDFLAGEFQVLVSTDAGGEGIDLQSAHVMIDWDIPWSLVRLEQRAGRLHRIGQTDPVFIYHLVSPGTREGRVQEVLLANLDEAGAALKGRIFDLMAATAERSGFDFAATLADAQRGIDSVEKVPSIGTLVDTAKELAVEEDALRTPSDLTEAQERFAADRLESINPVMVQGFLETLAEASGWSVEPGPYPDIVNVTAARLPDALGAGSGALVSVNGDATADAKASGARFGEIVTLGPTEKPFRDLLSLCAEQFTADLTRGAAAVDESATTPYTLFLFDAELRTFDGISEGSRPVPFLVRFSAGTAFVVDWTSVTNLKPATQAGSRPAPGAVADAASAADLQRLIEEEAAARVQAKWVARARSAVDNLQARWRQQVRHLAAEQRRVLRDTFEADRAQRLADLDRAGSVSVSQPRLVGWVDVLAGTSISEIGYDPNSEKPAIDVVIATLVAEGFEVDDRQTAGLGYDLFARNPATREQRLVEVKGLLGGLSGVTLESNEWAQAMQRGDEFWLYVVSECGTVPTLSVVVRDPAGVLDGAPKLIERFKISASQLQQLAEGTS